MKFKLLIILSLFSIAFLAGIALGINWNNPSNDAEEMIDSGETTVIDTPAGQAATPKDSRAQQANKSSLDWTMPSTLSESSNSAKSSRADAEASSEDATNSNDETASTESAEKSTSSTTASTTDTELPPVQAETAEINVGGSWSFLLNDTQERDLALSLFQQDGNVFGAGKMREGDSIVDVTASGTVSNSTMELNLVTQGTIGYYKLILDLSGNAATGQFQATTTSGETWTGDADGQKTA